MSIKQAIEALELAIETSYSEYTNVKFKAALAALRSMPAGPVGWIFKSGHGTHFKEGKARPSELMHAGQYVWQPLFATPPTAPVPLSDETIRLAKVALHEMPRPSTDWHEAAKRVCTAVVERAVLGRGEK